MNAPLQNNRPVNAITSFNAFMQKHKGQLELALPKHLNADRMVRLSLTAFSQNPALQKCDPKTIFGSIIIASQLGLEIGVNGQGYLVPYKDKCTFVPGWKGLVDLANRGGRCTVWTGAVYEGDEFDYMLGDTPYCKHKPCGEFDELKLTHVYAIGRVKDSEMPVIEVWPIKKVHAHFKKTVVPALQPNHYSKKHLEAYAKKVALLQVLKYMPQSIEMANAVDVSYASESGKGVTIDGDFVTVENNQQQEDQNIQNSTANDVNHEQNQLNEVQVTAQSQQEESQEDYAPTFSQIKRGILSAKSPAHLDVMEEQAMDHTDKEERKQLMVLVKAQSQKFQPISEVTAPKKPEPVQQEDDQVAENQNHQSEAQKLVQHKQPKDAEKLSSIWIRKDYLVRMNNTKSLDDLTKIHDEFLKNDGLTGQHLAYLKDTYTQLKEKFTSAKETPVATTAAEPDKIKSTSIKSGLERMIAETQDVVALEAEVARAIKGSEEKLTKADHQAVLMAYAQRKEILSQQDIFSNEASPAKSIDSVIQKIKAAVSQDEINAIFADPALSEFSEEDMAILNQAADMRESELQS